MLMFYAVKICLSRIFQIRWVLRASQQVVWDSREPVASPGHFDQYSNPVCLANCLALWGVIGQLWLEKYLSGMAGDLASPGQLWPDDV